MSVRVLPSSRNLTANVNLASFVARARAEVAAFGADLDFDSPVWDVTGVHRARASSTNQAAKLYFTTHDGGTSKSIEGRDPIQEPFASFLKAIVRLREEGGHVDAQIHKTTIRAGRYLYEVTAECGHDPCSLVPDHFQRAATACAQREQPSSAYRVGITLVGIADWANRYGISKVRIDFKNPLSRVAHDGTRIGREADKRRADKLPSEAALGALAAIANLVEDPADVLRIRCVELLACGGWRINELLTLPADCEVFDPVTENGSPVLDPEGKQVERYGIRYFGEKGAGPRIKWIPTPMVDVAKRAVRDITAITQPARDTLTWMATHPGRAKLPGAWNETDRHARFDTAEIGEMFGLAGPAQFVRTYKIPYVLENGRWLVDRADLETSLLSAQKKPSQSGLPLRPEQYFFVMPRNWAHRTRGVISSIIDPVMDKQISDIICGRDGISTIFSRFGLTEEDGRPIEITTHQFRHWLNTLAQQGGMSQMEIARWSGRKDVAQNADYDHRSGFEMAKRARELLAKGRVHGPIAEIHNRLPPVRREDFSGKPRSQPRTRPTLACARTTGPWFRATSIAGAPGALST